jgi:hypothetical protein
MMPKEQFKADGSLEELDEELSLDELGELAGGNLPPGQYVSQVMDVGNPGGVPALGGSIGSQGSSGLNSGNPLVTPPRTSRPKLRPPG